MAASSQDSKSFNITTLTNFKTDMSESYEDYDEMNEFVWSSGNNAGDNVSGNSAGLSDSISVKIEPESPIEKSSIAFTSQPSKGCNVDENLADLGDHILVKTEPKSPVGEISQVFPSHLKAEAAETCNSYEEGSRLVLNSSLHIKKEIPESSKEVKCFDEMAAVIESSQPSSISSAVCEFKHEAHLTCFEQRNQDKNNIKKKYIKKKYIKKKSSCKSNIIFQCSECKYNASIKAYIKRHVLSVHLKQRPYQCPHCDYKTGRRSYLKSHLCCKHEIILDNFINNFRVYCSHCDYSSKKKQLLKQHIKRFHIEKKCPQCDFKTTEQPKLNFHIDSVHTKKINKCPHCEFWSKSSIVLIKHIRLHNRMFFCQLCDFKTPLNSKLTRHINSKHTFKTSSMHICPQRDFRTSSKSRLKKHFDAVHGKV